MHSEKELIQRLQNKDQRALSLVYDQYSGAVYGVILRICKDEVLAQDILQEVFLKVWNKSDQYNSKKGKFFTWIYQIAKNSALNTIRNRSNLIQNEDLAVYNNKEEEKTDDYPELNGSLKTLDSHHQEAIELVYFNGLTHREAHEQMGVPLGTFKSYIKQALRNLRDKYQNEMLILIGLLIEVIRE